MEISGDLEAFRAQLLAEAATKKRRLEDHATQQQQALECKRLRGASSMSPKLVQDVLDLVIAAAVPEVFEVKMVLSPRGKISLLDGSRHGQVLLLERLVALMSVNRDCRTSVLREVGKKMGIRIKVWETEIDYEMPSWEDTLDSMLAQTPSQHGILAHAGTLEVQDMLLWDWSRDVIPLLDLQGNLSTPADVHQGVHRSFKNRYMRRYTATFRRQGNGNEAVYTLTNIDVVRWSRSAFLVHDHEPVIRVFQESAWPFERNLKSYTSIHQGNQHGRKATIQDVAEAAFHSSLWYRRIDLVESFLHDRGVVLRPRPATRKLYEKLGHRGHWEEDEIWMEQGV
ncbi:hypothetical protein PRZ48_008966 [Zasmidium cellare]|uniref:Uncharacterized protein n=1 Tax=Zasmidium cellare TaxID=395010 RepID=A0ABR0EGZ2_ZASCE|nr:hypothetical protein PRZ48_008966 [Zasmidium cellare]